MPSLGHPWVKTQAHKKSLLHSEMKEGCEEIYKAIELKVISDSTQTSQTDTKSSKAVLEAEGRA